MEKNRLENEQLASMPVLTPYELKKEYRLTETLAKTVRNNRKMIKNILDRKDPRMLVAVGPCSIHNIEAAVKYAHKLKQLSDELSDTLFIAMRVYL
jgi:3-deoxy-7-phosphoheptulonate synthase